MNTVLHINCSIVLVSSFLGLLNNIWHNILSTRICYTNCLHKYVTYYDKIKYVITEYVTIRIFEIVEKDLFGLL